MHHEPNSNRNAQSLYRRVIRAVDAAWFCNIIDCTKLVAVGIFWLTCFTLGYCIDTRPLQNWYDPEPAAEKHKTGSSAELIGDEIDASRRFIRAVKDALGEPEPVPDTPIGRNWREFWTRLPDNSFRLLEILLFWTWTNIFFLCCAASLLGQYGAALYAKRPTTGSFKSAVVKGVFVYLLAITGQLVAAGSLHHVKKGLADDQIHASSAHYFRIAGAASLFAFSLGYHPQLVTGIGRHLSRLDDHAPRPGAGSSTFPG